MHMPDAGPSISGLFHLAAQQGEDKMRRTRAVQNWKFRSQILGLVQSKETKDN